MKSYPSITKDVVKDVYIYAFDKLDGSNIRAEWNAKRGFYKFGTRTQLTDENTKPWGQSIPLLKEKYEKDLTEVFMEHGWKDALCFFEWWGPGSFAGSHDFSEKMDITLIDVNPHKQGIMPPKEFIELFGHLSIPTVVYQGYVSTELFDTVKQSKLSGMTFEGVVCKGERNKKTGLNTMFKIKSQAWLDKLKDHCKGDEGLFAKLA